MTTPHRSNPSRSTTSGRTSTDDEHGLRSISALPSGASVTPVPGWFLLGLIALLIVLTWLAGDPGFRVIRAADGLIDQARSVESAGWEKKGRASTFTVEHDGGVVLASEAGSAAAVREVTLPVAGMGDGAMLRLRGRVERLGAATFTLDDDLHTRVFLRWLGPDATTLGYGAVNRFSGQFRSRRFETVTAPPELTTAVELMFRTSSPSAWRLDGVLVDVVRPAPRYAVASAALIVCWTLVLGLLVFSVGQSVRERSAVLVGGVLAVLVTGVAFSQAGVASVVEPLAAALASWLPGWLPGLVPPSAEFLLESGHALGFGILVLALLGVRHALGLNAFGVLLLGTGLAFATEALQRHRPNRSPELGDVGVDLIGMLAALLVWSGCAWYGRRRREGRAAGAESLVPVSGHTRRRDSDAVSGPVPP